MQFCASGSFLQNSFCLPFLFFVVVDWDLGGIEEPFISLRLSDPAYLVISYSINWKHESLQK